MAEEYCDYISREPLKGWGSEGGFWRNRGEPPKVYYCALTENLCSFDNQGCFPYSDHFLDIPKLQRCPSRTLTERIEKD